MNRNAGMRAHGRARLVALAFLVAIVAGGAAWPRLERAGRSYLSEAVYQKALTLYEAGQATESLIQAKNALQLLGDDRSDTEALHLIHHLQGVIYHGRSSTSLAIEHLEKALEYATSPSHMAAAVYTLEALGQVHKEAGEFDKAVALYELAHAYRLTESPLEAEYWTTAEQLSELYRDLSLYQPGVGVDALLLENWHRQKTPSPPASAAVAALTRLGFQYTLQQRFDEARAALAAALADIDTLPDGAADLKASLHNNIGVLAQYEDRWADALLSYQRALTIREAQGAGWEAAQAQSHHNLGRLFLEQKKLKDAHSHAQKAFALSQASNGAKHPYTLACLELMISVETTRGRSDAARRLQDQLATLRSQDS